jgi:hypothetical protein|tara:strand:- start:553 stop:1110 length:558 start_codon:yes stop_codon:yes gene_type:complete
MSYVLFISEAKLKDSTALNLNIDNSILLPFVREAQKLYVETALGTDLTQHLKDEIIAGTLAGADKTLVDDYIGDMLPGYAVYHAIPYLRFKMENGNIYSKSSETGTALSESEAQHLREEVLNTASYYRERLIDYIRNNTASFPAYSTNTGSDVSASTENYYNGMNLDTPAQGSKLTLRNFLSASD